MECSLSWHGYALRRCVAEAVPTDEAEAHSFLEAETRQRARKLSQNVDANTRIQEFSRLLYDLSAWLQFGASIERANLSAVLPEADKWEELEEERYRVDEFGSAMATELARFFPVSAALDLAIKLFTPSDIGDAYRSFPQHLQAAHYVHGRVTRWKATAELLETLQIVQERLPKRDRSTRSERMEGLGHAGQVVFLAGCARNALAHGDGDLRLLDANAEQMVVFWHKRYLHSACHLMVFAVQLLAGAFFDGAPFKTTLEGRRNLMLGRALLSLHIQRSTRKKRATRHKKSRTATS